MNQLKEWKELSKIVLIGWKEFITDTPKDLLYKAIETGKIIKIDWKMINTASISYVEPFLANEIDQFVISITDLQVKERLQGIIKERKEKNLTINGLEHLLSIYISRFWEISTIEVNKW